MHQQATRYTFALIILSIFVSFTALLAFVGQLTLTLQGRCDCRNQTPVTHTTGDQVVLCAIQGACVVLCGALLITTRYIVTHGLYRSVESEEAELDSVKDE